jgi:hypothetical protein
MELGFNRKKEIIMSKCYDNPEYDDLGNGLQNTWEHSPLKQEQKQHLIDMMNNDEDLGLYNETFDEYLIRLKDRRTEDNYNYYTDEELELYNDYIMDCWRCGMSVYKCLEFMYFAEKEIKVEDVFNDQKREGVEDLIKLHKKYEHTYTNKEIRTWWLNQTEERRRDMVREYFKGGNSENINTLYGIMPEEMEEMYNINVDVVIMDWEEILFDFIDFYPCILPHELFMWLEENYEIPKKKKL